MPKKSLNFSHNRRSYLINRETFPRLAMILLSGVHNVGFSFLFLFCHHPETWGILKKSLYRSVCIIMNEYNILDGMLLIQILLTCKTPLSRHCNSQILCHKTPCLMLQAWVVYVENIIILTVIVTKELRNQESNVCMYLGIIILYFYYNCVVENCYLGSLHVSMF